MSRIKDIPLMPKATALWLYDNTKLTLEQISNFCDIDLEEILTMIDNEDKNIIKPHNPIISGQLTSEEIARCELNPNNQLNLDPEHKKILAKINNSNKKKKFVPTSKKKDKPDAILWFITKYPDISDNVITKLIGTTKTTIKAIRNHSHWNMEEISPKNPLELGLCSKEELEAELAEFENSTNKI